MPQDGSNNYQYPPGTRGVPDQTIESEAYNTFLDDLVVNDLNIPRPIHRGGTGATTAQAAMAALGGELASQLVTNYDSHIWYPGSFRSATTATGAPINGSAFAGWVYSGDPPQDPPLNQNLVVHAYDLSDPTRPGRLFTKEKRAGVWSSAWTVETNIALSPTPPTGMRAGALWWDNDNGVLYVNYNDGNTTQWVQAVALPAIDTTPFALEDEVVFKDGSVVMTGLLTLSGNPTADAHASTKQYVDEYVDASIAGIPAKVSKAGDVMTGPLVLPGNAVSALQAVPKQQLDLMGSYIDAPNDTFYARQGSTWLEVPSYERISLAGVTSIDVQVPTRAVMARISGMATPLAASPAGNILLQLSVAPEVFRTTAGEYILNGFHHTTIAGAFANSSNVATTLGILVATTHDNVAIPMMFDGNLSLVRKDTTSYFAGDFRGSSFTTASSHAHSFFKTHLNLPASGGSLRVLAFRLITLSTSPFEDESYLNVEWL